MFKKASGYTAEKEPELIAGLDLGTSKVTVVVAERDKDGDEAQIIAQIKGYAADSGEGRWTVEAAIENGVPMPATDEAAPAAPELLDYVRTPIPHGMLLDAGRPVSLRGLARQRAVLLVWVSTSCGKCAEIIGRLPKPFTPADLDRILHIAFHLPLPYAAQTRT